LAEASPTSAPCSQEFADASAFTGRDESSPEAQAKGWEKAAMRIALECVPRSPATQTLRSVEVGHQGLDLDRSRAGLGSRPPRSQLNVN
jgi:hypothetical protein